MGSSPTRATKEQQMKGETTLDQRINERLKWLDEVLTFYKTKYTGLDKPEGTEYLISQLIADATYLATYYGIDLETMMEETVKDTRRYFPDIP